MTLACFLRSLEGPHDIVEYPKCISRSIAFDGPMDSWPWIHRIEIPTPEDEPNLPEVATVEANKTDGEVIRFAKSHGLEVGTNHDFIDPATGHHVVVDLYIDAKTIARDFPHSSPVISFHAPHNPGEM